MNGCVGWVWLVLEPQSHIVTFVIMRFDSRYWLRLQVFEAWLSCRITFYGCSPSGWQVHDGMMIPFPMDLPTGLLGCSQVIAGGLPQTKSISVCVWEYWVLHFGKWDSRGAFSLSVHCSQGACPTQLWHCMTILLSLVKLLMKDNISGKIFPH